MFRLRSLLVVVASCAVLCSGLANAQTPQPLTAMPYSPSLDLTSLDKTADPCVDFYKFSCGGWQKLNPIPADQASWSVYAKLGTENQQFLWGILAEDAAMTKRNVTQQKIGDYFGACMNTAAIDKQGTLPAAMAMGTVLTAQNRAMLLTLLPIIHHEDMGTFFFNSGTGQDALDSSKVIAEVRSGGLGLPDRDYYLKTDPKSQKIRDEYVAYITQLFTLDGAGESKADAANEAAAVLRIETTLATGTLTRVERRDPHKTYHLMSIPELQALVPAINWKAYFVMQQRGFPQENPDPSAPRILTRTDTQHLSFNTLNVEQPEFMKAVQRVLAMEDLPSLKSYIRFHILTAAAPYLPHALEQANFDFFSHTLRGVPAMPPRWKTCVRAVDRNLGEALGQEFVARTFSADMKDKTRVMTEQIETAMQHEIENLDWMSPATKQEALRKLHAIRNKIGYPDTWRDYTSLTVKPDDYYGDAMRASRFADAREWAKLGKPVDLNEWGMTPPTVNAYFNPQMNDINFPAGVLQPPLYDVKLDDAPNYGNTGATIGHELTHAFDDEGRQFDSKGNLRDWWTPEDAKGFEDRINCIRDQYAMYVIVDDIHINSKLTSGEDVADLGGTLLAYIAWKKQTATQALSDRDGFTPDQRFFVGMAQWACENERPENLRVSAVTNPHSPGFARINGVVSNMPEFQKAFSCKAGQPMVHAPACRVW